MLIAVVLFITLKLKKYVNMRLKKLPFLTRYVPDKYKIRQMCDKTILEK